MPKGDNYKYIYNTVILPIVNGTPVPYRSKYEWRDGRVAELWLEMEPEYGYAPRSWQREKIRMERGRIITAYIENKHQVVGYQPYGGKFRLYLATESTSPWKELIEEIYEAMKYHEIGVEKSLDDDSRDIIQQRRDRGPNVWTEARRGRS